MKITQTKDIRSVNRWEVMKLILHNHPISRVDICNLSGLNKATVSTIVKEWIDAGLLTETERGQSASGRRPILLQPVSQIGYAVAVDIDIRNVQVILTDLSGERMLSRTRFLIQDSSFPAVYEQICQALDEILERQPPVPYGLVGIGIAVHGIVDLSGLIRFVPSLAWRNIDICTLLEERYHVPIVIDNDGNFAAIAHQNAEMGSPHDPADDITAQKPYQSLAAVNISDSISAGLISNGEVLRGYHGFANAIGHHTINFDEPVQCHCGKYGCWEQYCSDSAVIAYANSLFSEPISTIQELVNRIRHQDPIAKKVLDRFISHLAVGLTNIIFIYDCEAIAVNSELLSSLPYYMPEVLRRMILPITHSEQVVLSHLGKNGAVFGAAGQVIEHFFQNIANADPTTPIPEI